MYVLVQIALLDALYVHTYMYISMCTQRGWSSVFEVLRALAKRSTRKGKERKGKERKGKGHKESKGMEHKEMKGKGHRERKG